MENEIINIRKKSPQELIQMVGSETMQIFSFLGRPNWFSERSQNTIKTLLNQIKPCLSDNWLLVLLDNQQIIKDNQSLLVKSV